MFRRWKNAAGSRACGTPGTAESELARIRFALTRSHFHFFVQQLPLSHAGLRSCLLGLDRALSRVTAATTVLVVPLALLLCAQWPLRDWIHAYSREANDLAQLLFGIYVSVGITAATRSGSHLTPDLLARRYPARVRVWIGKAVSACIVVPWVLFNLYASGPTVWQSIRQLEGFPDTGNPGYFILKACIWLLALMVLLQALVDILLPATPAPEGRH